MIQILSWALVFSVLVACPGTAMADDPFKRLEVKLTQSGFAGEAGSLWIVEPSGKWSRQEVAAGQVQPVESQNTGVLHKEQLDQLGRVLQQNDIGNLPERLGTNTRANPRRLTIQWGERRVEIVTPAAVDPTALSTARNAESRLPEEKAAAIARTVQELTQK